MDFQAWVKKNALIDFVRSKFQCVLRHWQAFNAYLVNHMHVACARPGSGEPLTCSRWQRQQHSPKMITGHHLRQHTSPSVAEEVSIWSFILVVRFKGREMRVDRSCHGCVSGPENICLEASNSQRFDSDLWPGRYLDLFLLRQHVFIVSLLRLTLLFSIMHLF